MKYRALIEKLDWRGKIVQTVREWEDDFSPDLSVAIREFAMNGSANLGKIEQPDRVWFEQLAAMAAPAKSRNSFSRRELGVRLVAGEFYPGLGMQLVAKREGNLEWSRRQTDAIEEALDEK